MPESVGNDHLIAEVEVQESLFNVLDGFPKDLAVMVTSEQIIDITMVEEDVPAQGSGASLSNMDTHDLLQLAGAGGISICRPREKQNLERRVQIRWISRVQVEPGSIGPV